MDMFVLVPALMLAGYASGLIAGLLGVGGGIVLVPVLYQCFVFFGYPEAVQIHMAVGTSLAIICFTGVRSARSHWQLGSVDRAILLSWGGFVGAGALVGALAAHYIAPTGLKIIFAALALTLGLRMLVTSRKDATPVAVLPMGVQKIASAAVGFFSALMGIGGGTLSVPLLGLSGRDVHKAVGTSAALGVLIAVPATLGFMLSDTGLATPPYLSVGYISLIAVALVFPLSVWAAPTGAKLAHKLSQKTLGYIFAGFLLVSGTRMLLAIWV